MASTVLFVGKWRFFGTFTKNREIYDLFTQFDAAIKDISRSKHKLIVINDNAKINREDFRKISQSLKDSFEEKFSSKSSYEKEDTSEKNR